MRPVERRHALGDGGAAAFPEALAFHLDVHAAGLPLEQGALALDAPAVAGERAVGAHDPVAGNGDGDRIGGAGPRHGAGRLGPADPLGDLRVARRRSPAGTRAERRPDAPAGRRCRGCRAAGRGRAPAPRRSRPPRRRCVRMPRRRRRARAFGKRSCRSRTSASGSSPRVMAQTPFSVAATRIAPSEHSPTAKRIAVPAAAGAERRRRHAEPLGGGRVEAPARIEAGAVDRLGDRGAPVEFALHPARAVRLGIGLGRDAGLRLEDAVEMEAAHAGGPRPAPPGSASRRPPRSPGRPSPPPPPGARRATARSAGSACRAGSPARSASAAVGVKGDVLPPGGSCGAGRPAVNPGRAHRIEEGTIGGGIASLHGGPALGVGGKGGRGFRVPDCQRSHRQSPGVRRAIGPVFVCPIPRGRPRGPHSGPCSQIKYDRQLGHTLR